MFSAVGWSAQRSSVPWVNLSLGKELRAKSLWLIDPAGLALLVGDLIEPFLIREARLSSIHLLKPIILTERLEVILATQFLVLLLAVDDADTTVLICQHEDVNSHQLGELLEDGNEVLVAG